jgi:hypothetical protein
MKPGRLWDAIARALVIVGRFAGGAAEHLAQSAPLARQDKVRLRSRGRTAETTTIGLTPSGTPRRARVLPLTFHGTVRPRVAQIPRR